MISGGIEPTICALKEHLPNHLEEETKNKWTLWGSNPSAVLIANQVTTPCSPKAPMIVCRMSMAATPFSPSTAIQVPHTINY